MNRVRIVCVGKLKEKFWLAAQEEYLKRLSRYVQAEVVEVKDEPTPEKPTPAQREAVLRKEGERAGKAAAGFDVTIALAVEGEEEDSLAFAGRMGACWDAGRSVCFLIGGSLGLPESLKRRADARLSLSALTLPHRLARIVLLEQLYRACKIGRGENYHK